VFPEGQSVLPTDFDLMIPHRGDSRRARIVWRKQTDVGVQFMQYAEDRTPVEAARKINALKAQNAAFSRRVAQLSEPAY
jgi:hypothetical protein